MMLLEGTFRAHFTDYFLREYYLTIIQSKKSKYHKFLAFGVISHHLETCKTERCLLLKGFPEAEFLDH